MPGRETARFPADVTRVIAGQWYIRWIFRRCYGDVLQRERGMDMRGPDHQHARNSDAVTGTAGAPQAPRDIVAAPDRLICAPNVTSAKRPLAVQNGGSGAVTSRPPVTFRALAGRLRAVRNGCHRADSGLWPRFRDRYCPDWANRRDGAPLADVTAVRGAAAHLAPGGSRH